MGALHPVGARVRRLKRGQFITPGAVLVFTIEILEVKGASKPKGCVGSRKILMSHPLTLLREPRLVRLPLVGGSAIAAARRLPPRRCGTPRATPRGRRPSHARRLLRLVCSPAKKRRPPPAAGACSPRPSRRARRSVRAARRRLAAPAADDDVERAARRRRRRRAARPHPVKLRSAARASSSSSPPPPSSAPPSRAAAASPSRSRRARRDGPRRCWALTYRKKAPRASPSTATPPRKSGRSSQKTSKARTPSPP